MAIADEAAKPAEIKRLSLEEILKIDDIVEEELFIPEWQGTVRIRSFTKKEQQAYRAESRDPVTNEIDDDRLEMMIFIHGVVEPKFDSSNYEKLREKSAGALDQVLGRLMQISGLSNRSVKAAENTFPAKP